MNGAPERFRSAVRGTGAACASVSGIPEDGFFEGSMLISKDDFAADEDAGLQMRGDAVSGAPCSLSTPPVLATSTATTRLDSVLARVRARDSPLVPEVVGPVLKRRRLVGKQPQPIAAAAL